MSGTESGEGRDLNCLIPPKGERGKVGMRVKLEGKSGDLVGGRAILVCRSIPIENIIRKTSIVRKERKGGNLVIKITNRTCQPIGW